MIICTSQKQNNINIISCMIVFFFFFSIINLACGVLRPVSPTLGSPALDYAIQWNYFTEPSLTTYKSKKMEKVFFGVFFNIFFKLILLFSLLWLY